MSSVVADIAIWLLLFAGVGFAGIGLIGLLLFPDIRSRRYTAVRATLIGLSATVLAVILYGVYELQASGGGQYTVLLALAILLAATVFAGNMAVSKEILARAVRTDYCGPATPPAERERPDT